MRDSCYDIYKQYLGELNLNVGSALNHEPSRNGHKFMNLDMNPLVKPDIVHDMTVFPWPFEDNTFDSVIGSHIFEHIHKEQFLPMVSEIFRILKPGGHLLAFTPYGTSFDAWENPHHVQCFTETTWFYCTPICYRGETAGFGAEQGQPINNWSMERVSLVPYEEFINDPELEWKHKHLANVIREIQVVMRANK
jgi:SAM-dependent methyltransferase